MVNADSRYAVNRGRARRFDDYAITAADRSSYLDGAR
jgi:hypothetical protein